MRLGLILDNGKTTAWQETALKKITGHEIAVIYNCTNSMTKKRPIKHFLYYVLNILFIKNELTKKQSSSFVDADGINTINFESEYNGNWQVLPADIIESINSEKLDAVIKFGMGLLTVPDKEVMATPIISYHHGDPDQFRGRPAGFYEILKRADHIGVIIQQLTNALDAGPILAYSESKIHRHSYKKTIMGAYAISPDMLGKALRNLELGQPINKKSDGDNYRLPGNLTALWFIIKLATNIIKRLFYGAFMEKRWQVSVTDKITLSQNDLRLDIDSGNSLKIDRPYTFYADPFWLDGDTILVEALCKSTGKGALLQIDSDNTIKLTSGEQHFSYPQAISHEGKTYLLPEVCSWRAPALFLLEEGKLSSPQPLSGLEDERVIDPTYCMHEGVHYIFGGRKNHDQNILYLWHSTDFFGPYHEHPDSPISCTPNGSRMAGNLVGVDGNLLRFGQNSADDYGNGITVFKIKQLTPESYIEEFSMKIDLNKAKGPHTLNFNENSMLYDWYKERFSFLAGWRRFRSRL